MCLVDVEFMIRWNESSQKRLHPCNALRRNDSYEAGSATGSRYPEDLGA